MNFLFLTMGRMDNVDEPGIYTDLLHYMKDNGHEIYVVSPNEKRRKLDTKYSTENGIHILRVKIGNITKCNIIEKGISTVQVTDKFRKAIDKYLGDIHFDVIMYTTPPITLASVVKKIKKKNNAITYLLLKDIFPQNAVDIGLLDKSGIKGLIYKYFRKQEKMLYEISDFIGCMSQANVDYVLKHNPEIPCDKVEVCPNCIKIRDMGVDEAEKTELRKKYDIPADKKVFVYGGNLGKPQDIPYIIECLKTQKDNDKAFFLLVGDGTEFTKLENYFLQENPSNMKLLKRLPKEDYDRLIASCDVGMIFLDNRFTIPNFPSRLLGYMQAGLSVFACTDKSTDVGKVITDGKFGWWCESNDAEKFKCIIDELCQKENIDVKKEISAYLENNYTVEKQYEIIMNSIKKRIDK